MLVRRLHDGLRRFSVDRVAACGHRRIAHEVEVIRRTATRSDKTTYKQASYRGLLHCGSVWECPSCGLRIHAQRAEELKLAVEAWGPDGVAMLSLTVRHGLGDDLKIVRRGLSDGYRQLTRGAPWKRFRARYGLRHQVRGVDITHGRHGWHPHLHVLFFLEDKLNAEELDAASEWLQARWAKVVRASLGDEFVPNEHGVDLREAKQADYLAKLGFELSDPGTKRGRGTNRTAFQIASDAAAGDEPSIQLWKDYCAGMRGAKMLTWSDGLKAELGLDDLPSEQDIVDPPRTQEEEIVAVMPAHTWGSVRNRPLLPCLILDAAELGVSATDGFETIANLIRTTRDRPP